MTTQEFYQSLEADYASVLSRFMRSETMLQKYLHKFLDDPSFPSLSESMEKADYQAAWNAAHSLKGVASNLEFPALYRISQQVCDCIKAGETQRAAPLYEELCAEYGKIKAGIPLLEPCLR